MNIKFRTLLLSLTAMLSLYNLANASYEMPAEITVNVFRFLPIKDLISSARPVCKSWNKISKKNTLWKSRIIELPVNSIAPEHIGKNITKLRYNGSNNHINGSVTHFISSIKNCSQLTELYLVNFHKFKKAKAKDLGTSLSEKIRIKKLDISGNDKQYSYKKILAIYSCNKDNITELNISWSTIDDSTAQKILKGVFSNNPLKLKKLSLRNNLITIQTLNWISNNKKLEFTSLEELDLSGNIIGDNMYFPSQLIKKITNLKVLNIRDNGLNEESKASIKFDVGKQLKKLTL